MRICHRRSSWPSTAGLALCLLACVSEAPEDPGPGPSSGPPAGGAAGSGGSGAAAGGDGGSQTAAGGTGGAQAGPLEPLSPRTFVFSRSFPRKKDGEGFDRAVQLFAFDVESRSETLVSKLDDDGTNPNIPVSGPSLAPDRKWLAFGSQTFRFTAADRVPGVKSGALWKVTVDGRQFERLTPPFAESHVWSSLDVRYTDPVWSSDGATIFFQDWRFHTCPPFSTETRQCRTGGALRAVSGGRLTEWMNRSCYDDYPVSVKPDGTALLIVANTCTTPASGVHEIPTDPAKSNQRTSVISRQSSYDSYLLGKTVGTNLAMSSGDWFKDGSAILLTGTANTKKAAGPGFRTGLFRWSPPDKLEQIYEHADDATDLHAGNVSPSGEVIVTVSKATGGGGNVYLFDMATRTLGAQLTTSGDIGTIDW